MVVWNVIKCQKVFGPLSILTVPVLDFFFTGHLQESQQTAKQSHNEAEQLKSKPPLPTCPHGIPVHHFISYTAHQISL